MIVEFSVKNFRSIEELQTLSFVATGLKSAEKHIEVDSNNIAKKDGMQLFKTLGIYGANASGKSNVIKAIDRFVKAITKEASSQSHLSSLCDPFLYQENSDESESYFQITLIINEIKYRYGLTVRKNSAPRGQDDKEYSNEIITNEWLYGKKDKNMRLLFKRTNNEIENKLPNKENIPNSVSYGHSLYITHVAAFDTDGICKQIRDYLRRLVVSNFNVNHDKFRWMSINYLDPSNKNERKEEFLKLLASFNLNYFDAILEEDNERSKIDIFPQEKIILSKKHKLSENNDLNIELNLMDNESAGTQKLFDLAGLLLRAFRLQEPAFIILDEIDSNFHPSLLIKLISLFNNPSLNKSNSQLLFTSHDTNIMSPSLMRRDQFYFTEKNENQSTRLYSLADLKGIRNDADFAKQYLAGYYGALPILKEYESKKSQIDG